MAIPLPNPPPPPPNQHTAEADSHRRRVQRLTDASIALLLLLALCIVFVLDRRSPGKESLYAGNAGNDRFLFDPLHEPVAAVRQNPQRQEWIGAYGGTVESEAAVRCGLDWLARHQSADGHWGPDSLRARPEGRCKPGDVCSEAGSEHRLALTGLAVLAFQAGGHYDFNAAEYSGCVRHALDWLLAHQRPDGAFFDAEHNLGFCNLYETASPPSRWPTPARWPFHWAASQMTAIARRRKRRCSSSITPSTTTAAGATRTIGPRRATFPCPAGRYWR